MRKAKKQEFSEERTAQLRDAYQEIETKAMVLDKEFGTNIIILAKTDMVNGHDLCMVTTQVKGGPRMLDMLSDYILTLSENVGVSDSELMTAIASAVTEKRKEKNGRN